MGVVVGGAEGEVGEAVMKRGESNWFSWGFFFWFGCFFSLGCNRKYEVPTNMSGKTIQYAVSSTSRSIWKGSFTQNPIDQIRLPIRKKDSLSPAYTQP